MTDKIVPYKHLLVPPLKRAAYSDRTAWLMAQMSALAYIRFEKATTVDAALSDVLTLVTGEKEAEKQVDKKEIHKDFNTTQLLNILQKLSDKDGRSDNYAKLETGLKELKFKLIDVFSVHIPLIADTQAFIAKIEQDGREPFVVLSFRGTEPKKITDIKSDLDAMPKVLGRLGGPGRNKFIPHGQKLKGEEENWPEVKVHPGFWKAFNVVEKQLLDCLKEYKLEEFPLYITGHSLGGALAVVATHSLPSENIAACYTFGGPRVGNMQFGQMIRPPVYRFINAADIVPRLPPGVGVDVATTFLRAIPFIPYMDKLAVLLEKFRGYRHYGDLRYLSAAESVGTEEEPEFRNLLVLANPPQISRWYWIWTRLMATGGAAAASDHSIAHYVDKLAFWGHVRSDKS
ncbi:lipase family protein [Terasakiella sp. A23]|uniref:lipase family protein n=1 Tax=Terasakiella sp. FCG-A23 TaxID=3080561 RepID=UPI00295467D4|nr:lipase family protein [Terasakiella sp. A23]MDV7339092.1 lipase family protein [Terasakiella sp. A23]